MANCNVCSIDIDLDDEGGHIYPNGFIVCCGCEQ